MLISKYGNGSKELVSEFESRLGFSYLILNVDHDNTRAGSLYKKLGFSEFKNDGKTIVMCKQLD